MIKLTKHHFHNLNLQKMIKHKPHSDEESSLQQSLANKYQNLLPGAIRFIKILIESLRSFTINCPILLKMKTTTLSYVGHLALDYGSKIVILTYCSFPKISILGNSSLIMWKIS